jgi:hypothetical protein
MNVIPDADRFQHRALRNYIVGGRFCQTLYENLAAGSEILHRFCWLSESYEKVCKSHEVLASKIEKFMEDRVKILKENVELHELQARMEIYLRNMEVQLGLESAWKHRLEVCEAQLSKAHDDLSECQEALMTSSELLSKANSSALGEKVKNLEVCPIPIVPVLFPFASYLNLFCLFRRAKQGIVLRRETVLPLLLRTKRRSCCE